MRLKDMIFSNIYRGPSAFGLDISDFSIKIAQLEKKGKSFELKSYNRIYIPKGIIKEGNIKKEDELIKIIKKTVKESKGKAIKNPYAVCSLPEQHCFVKEIQLPKMKIKEAEEAIKWEAEANIPLSLEEVYLDWQIIHSEENREHLNVLISAAPKSLVDNYLRVLRDADVEPIVFEIESVATARSLIKNEFFKRSILIIDLGFDRTSFIIFSGDSVRFTSSISVSNQQMISDIAKKLKVSDKEARALKFKVGLNGVKGKREVSDALLPSIVELINQIKDCIIFYKEYSQKHNVFDKKDNPEEISKIILCGGGAYLKGLPQYLFDILRIPTVLGNPWVNILASRKKSKLLKAVYKESSAYSTVLGLALRGAELKF